MRSPCWAMASKPARLLRPINCSPKPFWRARPRPRRGALETPRCAPSNLPQPIRARGHAAFAGKAQIRLGEEKAARATLDRALDENPHGKVAYTRLAALLLRRDEPDETLRLANRLSSRGVGHSRLLALAKLGRVEAARAFDNLAPTDARALCGLRKRPSRVQQGARRAFRPIMKKPIIDLAFVLSLLRSPHLCRSCRP